jgi:prepilin-type N-terminal cleavage/methylation domain-containing protein
MRRRGFSLVETLVTSAILAVIAGAVAGVMSVAVRASGAQDSQSTSDASSIRLSEEISRALHVFTIGPGMIRFSVADQNGDLSDEVIEYAWSGERGSVLTRRVNDGLSEVVLDDVTSFVVRAAASTHSEPDSSFNEIETERVLARNQRPEAIDVVLDRSGRIEYTVSPAIGGDVIAWMPTALKLKLASAGELNGRFTVSTYRVNSSGRSSQPLSSTTVMAQSLSTAPSMVSIPLNQPGALAPSDSIIISIENTGEFPAARVFLHEDGIADRNGHVLLEQINNIRRRELTSGAPVYELSGIVTTDEAATRDILRGREIQLAIHTQRRSLTTRIPLLAYPQMPQSEYVVIEDSDVEGDVFATEEFK